MFKRMDRNKTGAIGIQELQHSLLEMGLSFTDVELATIFFESSTISYAQFKELMLGACASRSCHDP